MYISVCICERASGCGAEGGGHRWTGDRPDRRSSVTRVAAPVARPSGSGSNTNGTYSPMSFSFQLPERAIFHIKQYNPAGRGVSEWQLEEAQVFWARKEQSLALSVLRQMIRKLDASGAEVYGFFNWLSSILLL